MSSRKQRKDIDKAIRNLINYVEKQAEWQNGWMNFSTKCSRLLPAACLSMQMSWQLSARRTVIGTWFSVMCSRTWQALTGMNDD